MKQMGKNQKLELLYELYEKKMYKMAYSFLLDHTLAEDALQEAFIKVISVLPKIKEPESDKTKHLMMKIMKHTAIDFYRKQKKEKNRQCDAPLEMVEDTNNVIHISQRDMENKEMANYILSMLPDSDTLLLKLKYYYQLTDEEIADKLNISLAAERKRIQRLKKHITELKGDGNHEQLGKLFG